MSSIKTCGLVNRPLTKSDKTLKCNLPVCGAIPTLCKPYDKALNECKIGASSGSSSQTWPFFSKGLTNSSSQENTIFNSKNIKKLQINEKVYLPPNSISLDSSSEVFNFTGITSDEDSVYVTYETVSDGGFVAKINKSNNQVQWQFPISTYTGVDGDLSRSSPALYKDYLFIASNQFGPQTLSPVENDYFTFFPGPRGIQPSVLALRKSDGSLVWQTLIGDFASSINDKDNWITLTASPIVFDYKPDPNNSNSVVPVVAIGTSSSQSFLPWFYIHQIRGQPTPIQDPNHFLGNSFFYEMTDCGKFVLLNALTGSILSQESACDGKATMGEVIVDNPEYFAPGQNELITRSPVNNNDTVFTFGSTYETRFTEFSPIKNNYVSSIGTQNQIRYLLLEGQIVPTPVAGLQAYNNLGVLDTLPIIGSILGAEWDMTTITVDADFVPGTSQFVVDLQPFSTLSPIDFPDGSVVFKFWPAGGSNVSAVTDIAANTNVDVYQLGYFGSSTWGNAPSVGYDTNGNAAEVYFSTGQNHFITLAEQKWIYEQNGTLPYFEREQLLAQAQQTGNAVTIAAAYSQELNYLNAELGVALSGRGERNLHNSIVGINLRQGSFGQVMWNQRTSAYDLWNQGYTSSALRYSGNLTDQIPLLEAGWNNVQEFYVALRGADGDYGAGPVLQRGAHFTEPYDANEIDPITYRDTRCRIFYPSDALIGFSKYGSAQVLRLSKIRPDQPSTFKLNQFKLIGNSGTLGGGNYGIAGDKTKVYGIQLNTGPLDTTNVYDLPYPQNFIPNLDWYSLTTANKKIPFAQSFVTAFDFINGKVIWETEIAKRAADDPGFPISTAAAISVTDHGTDDIVIAQGGDGYLYVFRSSDGKELHKVDLSNAGNAKAIILKKDIWILSARNFSTTFPNSDYGGTHWLYKLGLPYHISC